MELKKNIFLREEESVSPWIRDALLVAFWSFVIAFSAHLVIPLPFTPVPLALRSFFVLLAGALLGSKKGPAAVLGFLAQGAVGMPVFAGGVSGPVAFFGPLGGYLVGYIAAAYVVGKLVEKGGPKSVKKLAIAFGLGSAAIYFCGAGYLSLFIGGWAAVKLGILPFLLGDFLKVVTCTFLLKQLSYTKKSCQERCFQKKSET